MKCNRCRRQTRNAGGLCTDCLNRKEEMGSTDECGPCHACKESTIERHEYKGKLYCKMCRDELRDGKVTNQNVTFSGGGSGGRDDISPWQENAIRNLEDM